MGESDAVRAFGGAVIFCVDEVTPSVRSICSQCWTGDAGWLWQENFDMDAEILEDILTCGGEGVPALLDEVSELSGQCFNEDSVEKSLKEGWLMSVLATSVPQGGRSLA